MIKSGITGIEDENWHNLNTEKRRILTAMLSSHLRTFFNLAQEVEYIDFSVEQLNRFEDRKEYLGRLIMSQ